MMPTIDIIIDGSEEQMMSTGRAILGVGSYRSIGS